MHFFQISLTWPYYNMTPQKSRISNLVDLSFHIIPINQTLSNICLGDELIEKLNNSFYFVCLIW